MSVVLSDIFFCCRITDIPQIRQIKNKARLIKSKLLCFAIVKEKIMWQHLQTQYR